MFPLNEVNDFLDNCSDKLNPEITSSGMLVYLYDDVGHIVDSTLQDENGRVSYKTYH